MAKIVISENVTLDGVVQDATGDEGFDRGGWFGQVGEADRQAWAEVEFAEALSAAALLMGRRTYEWFTARGWATRGDAWADRLRGLPKYVVSSTLHKPTWNNTNLLGGEVTNEVSKLKRNLDGDIVVYGSRRLVHTLMEHDLTDEVRLMIYPFVLGAGERLFGQTTDAKPLRLITTRTVGDNLLLLTYQPARDA
jgi:dihydrofolate reductase